MPESHTLVIFDIDGTLLHSTGAHHGALTRALHDFELDPHVKPWADYRHYTDSGVLDELLQDHHGVGASAEQLQRLDQLMAHYYETLSLAEPVLEVAGARALLAAVMAAPHMSVAFASGSMGGAVRLKLASLGLDSHRLNVRNGSHALSRADIVQGVMLGSEGTRRVILGDGRWDEMTARALEIPFIAVQTGLHQFGSGPLLVLDDLQTLTVDTLRRLAA